MLFDHLENIGSVVELMSRADLFRQNTLASENRVISSNAYKDLRKRYTRI